ncbi:fatty-acid--CoA ligase [Paralimibaculum aggregatum]|uniref:Fatty-acid--CoA ligase n=1 Tax=Paralimibaculum aggregatum TaxID=3036245 RepID=A0ABQ6LTT4_9RHOB|nr:long-chain-fatty-acid--CoA ligase [Limibaculum sp. NKW23]GMG85481.1 fatty-acid--CoA ligase [Limibaculum sp. NKW23]
MLGQMQDWPLRIGRIIDHAARYHGKRRILSRAPNGGIVLTDYEGIRHDALRIVQGLRRLGARPGAVIGAMAWNSERHLAVWYGVPGAGCALHSLNPRLGAAQLTYIINHAEDAWIFVDPDLVGVLEPLAAALTGVRGYIVMGAAETTLPNAITLDELMSGDGDAGWEPVDERAACGICYTSGTTGEPKGVVYSHRSNTLHAMAVIQPDTLGLSSRDVVMPVVPLFHANGWSLGFSGPMSGAAMVMPGRQLDPAGLMEMLGHGVTISAAVPTIWLPLLDHLRETGGSLPDLSRVVIGGSACPRAVIEAFQNDYGVRVIHAWGMTETSPLGTLCTEKPEIAAMAPGRRLDQQETVGHPHFTVDFAIRDEAGRDMPWDGRTQGRLMVRGPCVVQRYHKAETAAADGEGWFDTGDAAVMDPYGYVRITDRFKDLIKSGGEWISSIDLENAAVGHPDVAEAAAVAMPHPKWAERPVLVVVPRAGRRPDRTAMLAHLGRQFAKWQLPDDVVVVEALPHTATGKISKLTLRAQLEADGYRLPDLR